MIRLVDVPDVSRADGSWRDIYILKTTLAEWDRVLELMRSGKLGEPTFSVNGEQSRLPDSFESALAVRQEASPLLRLNVDGMTLNCHFFCEEEIELDLNPAEMTEERLAALLGWMRVVGMELKRDVLVTEENASQLPLLVYQPAIDRVLAISKVDREVWE